MLVYKYVYFAWRTSTVQVKYIFPNLKTNVFKKSNSESKELPIFQITKHHHHSCWCRLKRKNNSVFKVKTNSVILRNSVFLSV